MVVGQPIFNDRGDLLLAKDTTLSDRRIAALTTMGYTSLVIDDPETEGVFIPEVISSAVKAHAAKTISEAFARMESISQDFVDGDVDSIEEALQSDDFRAQASEVDPFTSLIADVEAMIEQILNSETLDGMNALMIHDDYTFQHSVDVAIVSAMIGKRIELPEDRLFQLTLGAMLHDVGKVFIPREIINKPGKLSDEEFDRIKAHPRLGWQMLRASEGAQQYLLAHHVCYQHHECQDGSGYPRGLRGRNTVSRPRSARYDPDVLHLLGEIGAVADTYEALIADRPYRPGFPPDKVREILDEMSDSHLNSEVLHHALEIIPAYPTGSEIEIVGGRLAGLRGVVAYVDMEHLQRPVVRLIWNQRGERIKPTEVDLLAAPDIKIRSARPLAAPGMVTAAN